jgi:UDP-glucose 4-epimerase
MSSRTWAYKRLIMSAAGPADDWYMETFSDIDASAFSGARCLVTGGLGFIGSNLARALAMAGAHVAIIDALVPGHGANARNVAGLHVDVHESDIGHPSACDLVRDAEIVFNVAGQVSHLASMRDPLRDLQLNALSHAAFLETVRAVNPRVRVVHTSTRQVYGRAEGRPVTETQHAQPVDINGIGKWAGEQLHLVHHQAYGLPATALRLTNVYGPRQCLTSNELGFLPVFVRKGLLDETIHIYGDGQQRRDLLYIDDIVRAILASAGDHTVGEVFNVGANDDHPLVEVADVIVDTAGGSNRPVLVPWPPEHRSIDIGSFASDSSKFQRRTGWRPRVALRDGISATIEFYRRTPGYLPASEDQLATCHRP